MAGASLHFSARTAQSGQRPPDFILVKTPLAVRVHVHGVGTNALPEYLYIFAFQPPAQRRGIYAEQAGGLTDAD